MFTQEALMAYVNANARNDSERMDAAETAVLFRKLEAVKARTYDVKYQDFKFRKFIPAANDIDPAADTIVYQQWDQFGMAKVIANYGSDLPRVDVLAREFRTPVKSIGAAYGYSIMDLRRARLAGVSLDQKRANAARRAIESKLDSIAAFGDTSVGNPGIPGFLTNDNVGETALTNGSWIASNRTSTQMLTDLHNFVAVLVAQGKEVFTPDTLILPTAEFARAAQTFMDTTNTTTVLRAFLNENPWIRNVDSWSKCDAVPVSPGVTRKLVVCYTRTDEVLTSEIPQEFEQFPPQPKGLEFEVPCHARTGGCVIRYPVAVRYGTGI